jgi:hypothetical protein
MLFRGFILGKVANNGQALTVYWEDELQGAGPDSRRSRKAGSIPPDNPG